MLHQPKKKERTAGEEKSEKKKESKRKLKGTKERS